MPTGEGTATDAQVERVLNSAMFRNAEVLRRLLKFIACDHMPSKASKVFYTALQSITYREINDDFMLSSASKAIYTALQSILNPNKPGSLQVFLRLLCNRCMVFAVVLPIRSRIERLRKIEYKLLLKLNYLTVK